MKPAMHTKEWLRWARNRARLYKKELAQLSGLAMNTINSLEMGDRGGAPETWVRLSEVLYPLVPAAYVDEPALLDYARKCGKPSKGRAKCRLYYATGVDGVVFTNVLPENYDSRRGPHIVVTWAEAEALLEAQKSAFE